jgi:hypothetical protein
MKKSEHKNKKRPSSSIQSSLALLRPRLDRMLAAEELPLQDSQAVLASLEAAGQGIKPGDFLAVLLKACTAAAGFTNWLDGPVSSWLAQSAERGNALAELIAQGSLASAEDNLARQWAAQAGIPVPEAGSEPVHPFYKAWTVTGEWQGVVIILWHTDRARRQVGGMSFLYDFNPPWEGAVKGVILFPEDRLERAEQRLLNHWRQRGTLLEPIAAPAAKTEVLKRLLANQAQHIRLPADLITAHDEFFAYIYSLPDDATTPAFSPQDFLDLCQFEQQPEAIMQYERTVGRRVRTADGKEILVSDPG